MVSVHHLRAHFERIDGRKWDDHKADHLAQRRREVESLAKSGKVDDALQEWFAMNVDAALKRAEMTREDFYKLVEGKANESTE